MKKNGFTLVELLTVIVIIAIFASITVLKVSDTASKRKKQDYENMVKLIEKNTEMLVSTNSDIYINVIEKLDSEDDKCKILYQTLIDNDLVDASEKNPVTGKNINTESYIIVSTSTSGDLKYEFINVDDETVDTEIEECISN